MTQIYSDGTYFESNPRWHEEDSHWKAAQIQKMINRNSLVPRNIAEIGCGAGEILNQLSKSFTGVEFSGYEISSQAFELCKGRSLPNLSFFLQDLLEDNTAFFDIVMAIDVIEHVEDYFSFLRKPKEKGD